MRNVASRRFLKLAALMIVITMLAGCGPAATPPKEPASPTPAPTPEPPKMDTLIVAQGVDMETGDPHYHNHRASASVHVNIFDGLVQRNDLGQIEPSLAKSFEVIDELTWKFVIRDDVLWHDGTPFTVDDVVFTLTRISTDEKTSYLSDYKHISEIQVVDKNTVLVKTSRPDPLFANNLASYAALMIPKHYYEQVGQEVFATKPIGTGPYKLVSWDRDDKIVMEAFDKHWRGVAAFKNLIHRAIPEDSTRLAEAMTGGVHVATGIPPVDAERLNASGVASAVLAPLARMLLFWCEMRDDAPTADLRVRQAIDYAIDNMALVRDVVQGAGTPVRGFVDDMIFGSARELNNAYRFDPDKARELLKDAGYGPGNELNIKVQAPRGRYPMDANVAEIVAVMLNEVGIKTSLEILEWSAYSERVANADRGIQSIAMLGLGVGNLDGGWAVGSNYTRRMKPKGYVNPELEDLLAKIDSNMNLAEREKQIQEAMRIIDKDLPFIFMYRIDTYWAVNNKVDWTPKIDEALWMFTAKPK